MRPEARAIQQVGAVVLAAGQSKRMGQPKLVLPWGRQTVIEHVVSQLSEAGIQEIVVVTGGAREMVAAALAGWPVRMGHNPEFSHSEMMASLQIGIRLLSPGIQAMLIVLGDQPTLESKVVKQVVDRYIDSRASLVIPSYQMRRGHPWLVRRELWKDLLDLGPEETMRDFLRRHEHQIAYIQVDSPGILEDMDTPEDYERLKPANRESPC
jgi:molybdenum cofactor cytidylyltransferase